MKQANGSSIKSTTYLKLEVIKIKNKYKTIDDTLIIYLDRRNGETLEVTTDTKFLDKLLMFNVKWYAKWAENTQSFYAQASEYLGTFNGKPKYKTHYLHKFIMDSDGDEVIDHKDHDTLNDRENNLKRTSNSVNLMNRKGANKNNKSGVKNVAWVEKDKRYRVQLSVNGKNKYFGSYENLEDAKIRADEVRRMYIP